MLLRLGYDCRTVLNIENRFYYIIELKNCFIICMASSQILLDTMSSGKVDQVDLKYCLHSQKVSSQVGFKHCLRLVSGQFGWESASSGGRNGDRGIGDRGHHNAKVIRTRTCLPGALLLAWLLLGLRGRHVVPGGRRGPPRTRPVPSGAAPRAPTA